MDNLKKKKNEEQIFFIFKTIFFSRGEIFSRSFFLTIGIRTTDILERNDAVNIS